MTKTHTNRHSGLTNPVRFAPLLRHRLAPAALAGSLLLGAVAGGTGLGIAGAETVATEVRPTVVSPLAATTEGSTSPTGAAVEPARAHRGVDEGAADLRRRVVARALAQVGDDYAAGAEGPGAFDCSGLTLFAWRVAGVELTHYSGAQFDETRRVPLRRARPGDLVFYLRGGAHHVGLYIGRGRMVHASDYGVGVIVSPIRGTAWTDAHFSGIGRVDL